MFESRETGSCLTARSKSDSHPRRSLTLTSLSAEPSSPTGHGRRSSLGCLVFHIGPADTLVVRVFDVAFAYFGVGMAVSL